MHIEAASTVSVKTSTLDDYCIENKIEKADLIKLDVEGFEVQAYHGMRNIVKKSPDTILFIEFTAKSYDEPEEFFNLLKKDFQHIALIDNEGSLHDADSLSYKKILENVEDWIMLVFSKNMVCDKK